MASRPDLTMLQNLNRRLRTGLWHIPPQWRALRRVPGWTYPNVPIKKIIVPHQHLYAALFQRLPMLRLEGARLGETAVDSITGSSTSQRSLTQSMVLRWHHLMTAHEPRMELADAFELVRAEYKVKLDNLSSHLLRARAEAADRHAKLADAKVKRDALHQELGRPERYAETLEALVNRALHLSPQEPHQYFSESMSRKLLKQLNKEHVRANLTAKTAAVQKQLDTSPLGSETHDYVLERGGPVPESARQALGLDESEGGEAADGGEAGATGGKKPRYRTPVSSLPVVTDSNGEPIPSPALFFLKEREWATGIFNGATKNSVGGVKDQRITEFQRHLDRMVVDEGATLADYLAYVLTTQIRVLQSRRLLHWPPYTDYLDSKIFFRAFRLLHTGVTRSSVHIPRARAESSSKDSSHALAGRIEKLENSPEEKERIDRAMRCTRCHALTHREKHCPWVAPFDVRAKNLAVLPSAAQLAEATEAIPASIKAQATPQEISALAHRRVPRCPCCASVTHSSAAECPALRTEAFDLEKSSNAALQPTDAQRRAFVVAEHEESTRSSGSLVGSASNTLLRPKVRDADALRRAPMTFQQAVTHQRLLTLLQSHLAATPLHSLREEDEGDVRAPRDSGYIPPRALPLTPFWQEMADEKIRYKHPGESWYNSRIEETRQMEIHQQEHDRVEAEQRAEWLAKRARAAAGTDAASSTSAQ